MTSRCTTCGQTAAYGDPARLSEKAQRVLRAYTLEMEASGRWTRAEDPALGARLCGGHDGTHRTPNGAADHEGGTR